MDVSSLCRPFFDFFFLVFFFLAFFFLILCLEFLDFHFSERNFFDFFGVAKVSRIDTQSQKAPELEFPIPRKFPYFILLSHIYEWPPAGAAFRESIEVNLCKNTLYLRNYMHL